MTIVGGYMFLPAATVIDPPLLPALGKDQVAGISALIGCLFVKRIHLYYFGRTSLQKFLILSSSKNSKMPFSHKCSKAHPILTCT